MFRNKKSQIIGTLLTVGLLGECSSVAVAAVRIEGQVQAGGGAVAQSSITLWAALGGAVAEARPGAAAPAVFERLRRMKPTRSATL